MPFFASTGDEAWAGATARQKNIIQKTVNFVPFRFTMENLLALFFIDEFDRIDEIGQFLDNLGIDFIAGDQL
jgi:hypothetical protein